MFLLVIITLVTTIPLASLYLSTICLYGDLLLLIWLYECLLPLHFISFFDLLSFFASLGKSILEGLDQISPYTDLSIFQSMFVPIMVYDNSHKSKKKLLRKFKGKAGVYQWVHKESGKSYVGSSIDLARRLSNYYSINYLKRTNTLICQALLLGTFSAFSISIMELCDVNKLSKKKARKILLQREQIYLDEIKPFFNILKIASSSLGFKRSKKSKKAKKGK